MYISVISTSISYFWLKVNQRVQLVHSGVLGSDSKIRGLKAYIGMLTEIEKRQCSILQLNKHYAIYLPNPLLDQENSPNQPPKFFTFIVCSYEIRILIDQPKQELEPPKDIYNMPP